MSAVVDVKHIHGEPEFKGWLYKWTNYLKGYQKRWFVLSNGLLSYYRWNVCVPPLEMVKLHVSSVWMKAPCSETVPRHVRRRGFQHGTGEGDVAGGSDMGWGRGTSPGAQTQEDDEDENPKEPAEKHELQSTLRQLSSKLEDLNTCNELIVKHGAALQRALGDVEQPPPAAGGATSELPQKVKAINERATLFRVTANAMINACSEYLDLASSQGKRWQRALQYEHEQRMRLEEMVEQLAKQHSHLEAFARKEAKTKQAESNKTHLGPGGIVSDEDEDEFHDAVEDTQVFEVEIPDLQHRRDGSSVSLSAGSELDNENDSGSEMEPRQKHTRAVIVSMKGRTEKDAEMEKAEFEDAGDVPGTEKIVKRNRRLRIADKPNYSLNLWSIMKNCIGKELTKIPMPVSDAGWLIYASPTTGVALNSGQQHGICCSCESTGFTFLFYISSVGIISAYTRSRDSGVVSHHPPAVAQYTEGRDWIMYQEFTMSSKFRGKYLNIIPLGITHLEFPKSGHRYTWRKVMTTVHNIIVGKLWIDQSGEMDIINHKTKDNCHLKYYAYSYFSREPPRKVTGVITDVEGKVRRVLSGHWDDRIEGAKVLDTNPPVKGDRQVLETGPPTLLWKRNYPTPESARYYYFTTLAAQMNEMEENVPPTDSRLRPDQRAMEECRWDEANDIKLRLEEKQRVKRREKEMEAEKASAEGKPFQPYEPVWFRKERDPYTGNLIHMYKGIYWECKEKQDWRACPDIFV
ncbi:PREDICTED: oxysterol-binding protein 1-like [Priapulus caudatus]|uniref:Oxysterol-binding protein 1-like n=1 Tax=Priapulus caudatus TaxID=37621 RepID=A0ABM1EFH1_PRICU|nr:PREDICTED: oxysterol-binding protein 1-like [Priapulus caudatus]